MTLGAAIHKDLLIGVYIVAAFLFGIWVTCQVLDVLGRYVYARFCHWRTRRLIDSFRKADARTKERRNRDLYGETLVDELGALARSADRDNVVRMTARRR